MHSRPPGATCGRPQLEVAVGRLGAVAAVDEQQRQRGGPVRGRPSGESPTTATTDASSPASCDRAAEDRQRVDPADGRVDEVGLVPLPPGLVLLGAAVVVDGEQHGAGARGPPRRGRSPTCRSSCRSRAAARRRTAAAAAARRRAARQPSSGGMKPRAARAFSRRSAAITSGQRCARTARGLRRRPRRGARGSCRTSACRGRRSGRPTGSRSRPAGRR